MIRKIVQKPLRMIRGISDFGETLPFDDISHIPGQASAIRFFDPDSESDYVAIREILTTKDVREWMDDSGKISRSDYREWAGKYTGESFLFAVHDSRLRDSKAFKQIKGFVNLYSDRAEKFRLKRLIKAGILDEIAGNKHVLEISMALKPFSNGSISGSGLMSSALRQSCIQAKSLLGDTRQADLILYGFTNPLNSASIRTLEACGFIYKGRMKYDPDSEKESLVYVLSWRKLHRKIKGGLLKLFENSDKIIKVHLRAQITDSHCGPAVVQSLLKFNDIDVSQDDVVNVAKVKSRLAKHGMRPDQLAKAIKILAPNLQFWFKQYSDSKDLDILIHQYKIPVAIGWQGLFYNTVKEEKLKKPSGDNGHYSIVIDINRAIDKITIADPYYEFVEKPRLFSYRWFKTRWWDFDHLKDKKTGLLDSIHTKKLIMIVIPKKLALPSSLHLLPPEQLSVLKNNPKITSS